ncbi:MAG: BTAD domain-containing putative transcriptional regulator [Capsulimonas sp.]|uniref:AfsR/SARP family transcriptional regulator n=1 Tax=Capsulimonas sp. TaxID=2494211 RepID=UPI003265305E
MESPRAHWKFELLGAMRGRSGDLVLERFQTQKTASLLAYLAYFPIQRHTREALIDLLWPDADLDAGRNRLSQAVGWLRTQLEPSGTLRGGVILSDRQSVGLDSLSFTTDVGEFEKAVRNGQSGDAVTSMDDARLEALQNAAALYHGDLLPGYYDDWVLTERERLLGLYLPVLRRLIDHHEKRHEWESALDYARRALAADPIAEELHCNLIRLLGASGQPAAAVRQFKEMERLLAKELGDEPSPAAREMMARIRQNSSPNSASPAPMRAGSALPMQMTRFFGRELEIAQVQGLIETGGARLVTLAGMGGAGKTRLAIETAARLRPHFQDAVFFAPLADLSDARLIPGVLTDLLMLPPSGDAAPLERVAAALAAQPSLLVLDNLEHLIDEATPIVRSLLERAPSLTILITSRQRLNLNGEREIDIPPLDAPTEELSFAPQGAALEQLMRIDSVRLFVDRAQAVRPSFALTPQNASDVARLCARLDGLPLAIELCAAWAQTLTPTQMVAHLNRRFDLLVSRRTDIAARHRTLRATLEYSFLLLSPDLQAFFVRLSVFRGGWTLESATAICREGSDLSPLSTLEAITELHERSLVTAEEAAGEMRYRMLETLREFAVEQWTLAVEEPLQKRHAEFFLALAEQAGPPMASLDQTAWFARLDAEHDNLRAALDWLIARREGKKGLRMAVALSIFWEMRGYLREAQQRLELLLSLNVDPSEDSPRLRARALHAYANALHGLTDLTQAESYANEALTAWRALGDASGMAASLEMLGEIAMMHEDYEPAVRLLEEARSLALGAGDEAMSASAVHSLGRIALARERWSEAWDALSESLRLHRMLGNQNKAAAALNNLGLVARYRGDLEAARDLLHQALSEHQKLGDRHRMAISQLNIGTVNLIDHRYADSRSALAQAMKLSVEIDDRRVQAWCVKELGHLTCAEGHFEPGVRLLSASESLRTTLGISFSPADPEQLAADTARAKAALGDATFAAAWAAGGALSASDAVKESQERRA